MQRSWKCDAVILGSVGVLVTAGSGGIAAAAE